MKIIAYITNATSIQKILAHIGEESEQPKMHSARGPPDNFYHEDGKLLNINTIKLSIGENRAKNSNRQ